MIEQTSVSQDKLLKRLTEPLYEYFGIDYFCYQFVSNEGRWFTMGNNPDWLLHSAEQQFYKIDPSLVDPSKYIKSSLCFPKNHQHDSFQKTLVNDAIGLFDIDHALALIEPNAHGCEYFFFGAPGNHFNILNIYLTQIARICNDYTRHVKAGLRNIFDHCLDNAMELTLINPEGFNSNTNVLAVNDLGNEIGFSNAINNLPLLSSREYECISLYQQGLTAKQSAQRLGLSHRTVEDHFEAIKIKYKISSKRDLLNQTLFPRS